MGGNDHVVRAIKIVSSRAGGASSRQGNFLRGWEFWVDFLSGAKHEMGADSIHRLIIFPNGKTKKENPAKFSFTGN